MERQLQAREGAKMRRRLAEMGGTNRDLAKAARMTDSDVAGLLGGHIYWGPRRYNRLLDALHALAIELAVKREEQARAAARVAEEIAAERAAEMTVAAPSGTSEQRRGPTIRRL